MSKVLRFSGVGLDDAKISNLKSMTPSSNMDITNNKHSNSHSKLTIATNSNSNLSANKINIFRNSSSEESSTENMKNVNEMKTRSAKGNNMPYLLIRVLDVEDNRYFYSALLNI
jgi:hypothetical protein